MCREPDHPASPPRPANRAFTRTDLLAVVATLVLLVVVSRPVWGTGGPAKSVVCMDNLRRLQSAWLLYAEDQGGRIPLNQTIPGSQHPVPGRIGWVSGVMSWDTATYNTNTAYLTDSRYAGLAVYAGRDPSLHRCPEDTYLSPVQVALGWIQRARSYAINHFMGSITDFFLGQHYYHTLSDLRNLSPQRAFVLMEEHPDSINDPTFIANFSARQWADLPAAFHDRACWFSFADGHLELRRWQSATTVLPVRFFFPSLRPLPPGDPDWTWVQERASESERR